MVCQYLNRARSIMWGLFVKSHQLPTQAKDMFCYGIYTASHMVNRTYTSHLSPLGLTYPQYITLTLLWETDGQKVTELADQLRMSSSTLTPLLKRLETHGYIRREQGKRDRRETIVHLTAQGVALQREAPEITACMVAGTSLDHAELVELQRLLGKVCNGLATVKPGAP
jgi:DNA-binding MarR family transcriptional regulator